MNKFYDTNAILDLMDNVLDEPFIISSKTLEELESIKVSGNRTEELRYKARKACHLLDENQDNFSVVIANNTNIYETLDNFELPISPDNVILASAYLENKKEPLIFISNDVVCKILGRNVFGLTVESVCEKKTIDEYKGYKEITLTDEKMAYFYSHMNENQFDSLINEYLIIKNSDGNIVEKRKWNGESYILVSFKQINNDFIGKIKPRNMEQELAFDMLQDKESTIKVLTGGYGTGKDYLMVSTALDLIKNHKYDKIMWVRNNIEVKNSKPIGFLPNGMKDKLLPFAMVMADHLGGVDGLELLITQQKIEIGHLGFMRGRDIKNTIIMCSEAENMTKEHIQLLIGRVGEGSALWLNGDYRQTDDNVFENNNGLIKSIERLKGNRKFGFVKLKTTERSETAQLADLLD